MKSIYKKLSIILVTTTAIALPPAQAEIPFTQAVGVYQNTKEDKKNLSPFWGFVALHGKMLETIRFFGNYSKNIMEEPDEDGNMVRHEADMPNDKIATLIKRLFNSPDGVQFVATDYEGDPVGNLSRNLPYINTIIQILVEGKDKKSKVGQITSVLNALIPGIQEFKEILSKIENINHSQENETFKKESEIVLAEFNSIIEKYKNNYDPKKLEKIALRSLSSSSNSIDDEIQRRLTEKEMEIENKIRQLSVEEIKNLATEVKIPFTNEMPKGARNALIKTIHGQTQIPLDSLSTYADQQLREIAAEYRVDFKENWQEKQVEDLIQKLIKKELADKKDSNIKIILKEMYADYNLSFDNGKKTSDSIKILKKQLEAQQRERTVPNLSPISLVPIAIETFEKDNSTLANLLVDAYEAQGKFANPVKAPNEYLYPENIVVTALLAFFVKVANNKTELNALSFLMDEKNPLDETAFTKEEYLQNTANVGQIVQDSRNNPEPAFLMARGFDAFESIFSQPVSYLGSTPYRGQDFPDCGETSLRNVFEIFLSASNGGFISEKALESLRQKLPANVPLENSPFSKMMTYFNLNRNLVSAASNQNHANWAEVVSDLNDGKAPKTLNDVQYGLPNDEGVNTYEIKSKVDRNVKGIVNMFNVIAKLIPDEILNELWSENRTERLKQVRKKLDRFCKILSWGALKLSWENRETNDKKINNEFLNIVFMNHDTPIFEWRFVPGHFQLDPLMTAENDWRLKFQSIDYSNEWMASLFLKANENEWLQDNNYGTRFPLSLIYSKDLRSTDGALKILSFVLYKNVENKFLSQFQPLMSRWIEKSIPLNDPYSLDKISLLLYSCNSIPQIQNLLKRNDFNPIEGEVNQLKLLEKTAPNAIMNSAAKNGLNTGLYLISKRPGQWTSLDLTSNDKITDAGLAKLTNLTSLSLYRNSTITNDGLAKLTNLTNLNLGENDTIENAGLANLTNLTSLNLYANGKVTINGIANLTNLTSLDLTRNNKIADDELAKLTNLMSLNLSENTKINDDGIVKLTNLTSLDLTRNNKISDHGLAKLTNLTSLNLTGNYRISKDGIAKLTNLTSLNLSGNSSIMNDALANLTNLTSLNLYATKLISNDGIANLTNLTSLDLQQNDKITDTRIASLTKLVSLNLSNNKLITKDGIGNLTNLTNLNLSSNDKITDAGLANLTNLTSLGLSGNGEITDKGLANLPHLKSLNLYYNQRITNDALAKLTNLTSLDLQHNTEITDAGLDFLPNLKKIELENNTTISQGKVNELRSRGVDVIGR